MSRNIQRIKFAIRDDDLNYFSKPSDILKWYGDVFSQGISVGFSAIPFVKPISDVYPRDIPPEDREYPISRNGELIEYVKKNPLIEVLQHGCTHETQGGIFEYKRNQGLFEETFRGKEELEKAFEREVGVFVPPHDTISNHGIMAVEKADMDIVRGTGSKNIILRQEYYSLYPIMLMHRMKYLDKNKMPAYPHVLNFGKHKEAYSNRLREDNLDTLLKHLTYTHEQGGNFIVTGHLHHFTEKRKENLKLLIGRARELDAEFVKFEEIFRDA
jgi:hypothetical protein